MQLWTPEQKKNCRSFQSLIQIITQTDVLEDTWTQNSDEFMSTTVNEKSLPASPLFWLAVEKRGGRREKAKSSFRETCFYSNNPLQNWSGTNSFLRFIHMMGFSGITGVKASVTAPRTSLTQVGITFFPPLFSLFSQLWAQVGTPWCSGAKGNKPS